MAPSDLFATFMDAVPLTGSAFRAYLRRRFRDYHLDLTLEMMQVLHYLWGHDGVSQQEIARAANRDKATMTAMLDNLVRRDLVERRADLHDRRTNRVVLTPKGQALEQQVKPLVAEMFGVAGQGVAPDQLRTCLDVLTKITKNLTPPEK
ncbi:MarR family winged helix-turn-helix transcriptional regulator [Hymenobacter bucti]|uniref:MarR family winged helix-turn-helix transcriptional regulator n=1 Tax=Hymenobacter bucti TaxID=1844114 RepID=A0ABW4QT08_9BACT